MAYIKVPVNYLSLPKIRKYIRLSGDHAAILPIQATILAAAEDPLAGSITVPSAGELERECKWRGDPGRGVDAMIKARLLIESQDGYSLLGWESGWEEEQGHILKNRAKARKAAKALWNRPIVDAPSNASSNAPSITREVASVE